MLELTDADFLNECLKSNLPMLVCFYSDPDCTMLKDLEEKSTSEEYKNIRFGKINLKTEKVLASRYSPSLKCSIVIFQKHEHVALQFSTAGDDAITNIFNYVKKTYLTIPKD